MGGVQRNAVPLQSRDEGVETPEGDLGLSFMYAIVS
jgi:hypothetical protein